MKSVDRGTVADRLAERAGLFTGAAREEALRRCLERLGAQGIRRVRVGWCDLHGNLRGKTLTVAAAARALREGLSLVSTVLLKDSSDRTAFPVFEPDGTRDLPGFGQANNLLLLPDPESLVFLPWAPETAWLRAQPWFEDGTPVTLDTRWVLQQALARLNRLGLGMRCGLEVEFHIYRIDEERARLDPQAAAWPGEPPSGLTMIHPGYHLLGEAAWDLAHAPLSLVQDTAEGLGLPLSSLEIEFGPSQVEAVFDATDALSAADAMVLFRNGVRMALRRAGYYASFVCRPPFPAIMSSGWHLHQSLVWLADGRNAFMPETASSDPSSPRQAAQWLSRTGQHYLAGLLAHAHGMSALATPTINGYGRYQPNALAPQACVWGRDNRGALLRVLGGPGDRATRIENRLGEPAANPYLYIASQIHAGLAGLESGLEPPLATEAPYAAGGSGAQTALPTSLDEAITALSGDHALRAGLGEAFVDYFVEVKRFEIARHTQALDKLEFDRREYFSRI